MTESVHQQAPRIPPSQLPPAFIVRRWPALAALADNPLFIRRFYSKRPRQGWISHRGNLIGLTVCGIGIIANPRLGPLFPLGGWFFLGFLFFLVRLIGSGKPALQIQSLIRHTPQPYIQELWLTALTPADVIFAMMGPALSRKRLWSLAAIFAAAILLFCGLLIAFGLHGGFVAIYAVILGGMAAMSIRNLDAFQLSSLYHRVKSLHGMHTSRNLGQRIDHLFGSFLKAVLGFIGLIFLIFLIVRIMFVAAPLFDRLEQRGLLAEGIFLFMILLVTAVHGVVLALSCLGRERNIFESQRLLKRLWDARATREAGPD